MPRPADEVRGPAFVSSGNEVLDLRRRGLECVWNAENIAQSETAVREGEHSALDPFHQHDWKIPELV